MRVHVAQASDREMNELKREHDLEGNIIRTPGSQIHSLMNVTKIIQYTMTMFGIYHKPYSQTRYNKAEDTTLPFWKRNLKISPKILLSYNVFIIFLLWSNILRIFTSFFIGDSKRDIVVLRIICGVWYIMCAVNATMLVKSSHPRTGHQFQICDHWTKHVLSKLNELDIDNNTDKLRRKFIVWLVIGWVFIVVNCITVTAIIFFPHLSEHNIGALFRAPFPESTLIRILVVIMNLLTSGAWVFPVVFVMTMSTVFTNSFHVCNSALGKLIDESKGSEFATEFYRLRRLHLDICKGVEVMDKDFSVLFANWYLTNIPIACLVLFHLIKTDNSMFMVTIYLFWVATAIVCIVVTSGVAASLNQAVNKESASVGKAHSSLEHIYYMGTTGLTMDQMGQLQLFLSKLTGNSIGFTVLNFIVITREMLLTLGGLFLTYFFVLIQF